MRRDGPTIPTSTGIDRRRFLKVTAAGFLAATAGGPLLSAFSQDRRSPSVAGTWMASTCQGCTSWCPVQVKVLDGRAVSVRGNPYSKANHGKICPRPHMALQQVYDPDRLKVPMKRTNPKKGRDEDPGFVPISWDEAIGMIADKMIELRNTGNTHQFAVFRGRYTNMRDILYSAVPKIFGSPNGISHSAICAEAEKFGSYYTEGFWDYRDYDLTETRYVLAWGADPVSSNRQVPHAINVWGDVRDRATIAVIDPRLSATAAKADEWLPVIPGEDGALAVAIAHVILTEGLWSRSFVGDFADGVNAFRSGRTVDAESFEELHTYGVVHWWNDELKDRTPEWAAPICGIPAEQIRRVAIGFAEAAPRAISWVSPGASMQVRGGYTAMAAHALNGLVGATDARGGVVQKAKVVSDDIPDLSDYQDELAKTNAAQKKIDQRGTLEFPVLNGGKSGGGVVTNRAADGILDEDPYPIQVAIGYWCNFAFSASGAERWERALAKLPFFAHITTNASETSFFADVVLPAAHQLFERWGFIKSKQNLYGTNSLMQPLIEPMWDVRQDETEIPWMLAEALAERGFDAMHRYFQERFEDPETGMRPTDGASFSLNAVKLLTRPVWDSTHADYGKFGDRLQGWEDFVAKGVWNSNRFEPGQKIDKFATKTTKFEFYSETLKDALGAHAEKHGVDIDRVLDVTKYEARGERAFLPHYEPAFREGDPETYPFIFFEHRSRLNREGRSANCTWYQAHKNADPGDENWDDVLKINPVDALPLGLANGDTITVESPTGTLTAHVKLWEGVRPGTVTKCFGQGHWAYGRVAAEDFARRIPRGGNNNQILPAEYDRLSGSTARHGGCTRVAIRKVAAA